MARTVTVTFDDNTQHVYQNVPETITPDQIEARASSEFGGRKIVGIDGGKGTQDSLSVEDVLKMMYRVSPIGTVGRLGESLEKTAYKAGGAVTDVLSGVVPHEAAAAAGYATDVGLQALPGLVGGSAMAKLGAPAMDVAARRAMMIALKPSPKRMATGKGERAIETMLDEGYNVSHGSLAAMKERIMALNSEISDIIKNSNAVVNKSEVLKALNSVVDKFKNTVTPQADLKTIAAAGKQFERHPLAPGEELPIQLAQKLKQGTYKVLDEKYGELGTARVEAEKGLARGLKEEIAKLAPQVSKLNAEESALLNAELLTQARLLSRGTQDPMTFAWLTHNPGAAAGWVASRSPFVWSLLAHAAKGGREAIPYALGAIEGAIYGASVPGKRE